ncbi:aminotransferase class III-fold pyridoxal phosphate-dependent enzyme [Nocardioides sp. GY 10127]|uniref:aspartate aminotransferase family protein n=1 Tax=Nocardioides sp. GY 10127 TaxID=2569762 RepID=UPI0010A78C9D|nr:aminotransferase class III-fold pyridoxal phosphate-dependent enzyme [Nocardioides sp. GY 10127]TIC79277.1 aminotransferase class III-fold pyridoxal phosphate-dependent enzyme [Nocardioides sp. GY 10127]
MTAGSPTLPTRPTLPYPTLTTAPAGVSLYERDARAVAGIEKLRFFPIEVVSGHGSTLVTPDGSELLDLSATWTACGLGHGHPAVAEALARAAVDAPGAGGLSAVHPASVGLAEDLLAVVPGSGDRRVYLGHAGSDANDVAIRAARHATGQRTVVAFEHSYHGGVGVAMGVSGVHVEAGAEADPDAVFLPYPNPFRPGPEGIEADVVAILAAADEALASGTVACLLVEPMLSDGGMVVPPDGFLARLHEVCRRHGVLMICDEVKVGLGRPGLLHAFAHDGIEPEIVTFGKALGGGLPLSAAVGPADVLDGPVGSALLTTAGNPLSTAVGRAVLATLVAEELPQRAATVGAVLAEGLRAQDWAGRLGEVRGRGLMLGVELVDADGAPDPALAARTVYRAWQLGAVVHYVGGNTLEVTPPLVLTAEEAARAAEILGWAVRDAAAGVVTDEEVAPYAGW